MSKNKKNARREAYQARQEQEGRKVVNWIFGILVALAVAYIIYVAAIV